MQLAAVRNHKTVLKEILDRGNPGLSIQYSNSLSTSQESVAGQQLWVSVVRLVGSTDGSVKLMASGQGNKKSNAQSAAAAALMALPAFEALLQQPHTPALFAAPMQQQHNAAGMLASPPPATAVAAGGARATTPPALAPAIPAQQAKLTAQASTGRESTEPILFDISPPYYIQSPSYYNISPPGADSSTPAAATAFASAGMQAGTAAQLAPGAPAAAAGAGSAAAFDASTNYKAQLQECVQRVCVAADAALMLPSYTSFGQVSCGNCTMHM
jgi:hypothetical protein